MPSQVAFREHTGLNSQHFYLLLPVFLTVGTTADGGIKVQKFRTKKFFASHTSQSKQQKKSCVSTEKVQVNENICGGILMYGAHYISLHL